MSLPAPSRVPADDASVRSGVAAAGPVASAAGAAGDWPTQASGYELVRSIGEGAFAKVFLANCPAKGELVAIKVMELEQLSSNLDDIRQEVATMKLCDHPNVLTCYCCFSHDKQLWLVMPYMDYGSCVRIIRQLRKKGLAAEGEGLREEIIWPILTETLKGMQYLHKAGWIHRDIKAGNILVNSRGEVKIADFGVAGLLMEPGEHRRKPKTFVGTPCWMAPEVIEKAGGYTEKADIWSLGITVLELIKGHAPYAHHHAMKVLLLILKGDPPSLKTYADGVVPSISRSLRKFVEGCLRKQPEKRYSVDKLLALTPRSRTSASELLSEGLLPLIADIVTAPPATVDEHMPGTQPLFDEAARDEMLQLARAAEAADEDEHASGLEGVDRVPGTTWVDPVAGAWGEDAKSDSSSDVEFQNEFNETSLGEHADILRDKHAAT